MNTFCKLAFLACVMAANTAIAANKSTKGPQKPIADLESVQQDKGPSLEVTAKFIEDKANEWGIDEHRIHFRSNTGEGYSGLPGQKVHVMPGSCTLTYDHGFEKATISLKDIRKMSIRDWVDYENELDRQRREDANKVSASPTYYFLLIHMPGGKGSTDSGWAEFRGKRNEWNLTDLPHRLYFADKDLADRVAKALNHAAELCGAGANEPF